MPSENPYFTVPEARARLHDIRRGVAAIVDVRADLVELQTALGRGEESDLGGRAELKALEARLDTMLSALQRDNIQIKGWAPILVDFPARLDGHDVYLCWLEGEPELAWYHRVDLGFPGRRPLP